ncbi:MAG: 5-formyltetrahydrofolate cyclo-ligase [Bacteroidota bacterium]|nr:5-formyltetrahydrofolate cyclo-ligase [Bacteroidota bacterium]
MNKNILRKIYLEKRKQLKQEELLKKNEQILTNLFNNINFKNYNVIHTFLPILKNNEINIWSFLMEVRKNYNFMKIVISKSDFELTEMKHFLYREDTILVENQYGIPEPDGGEEYHNNNFDLVFVPLVIFDLNGNRVGYGKGFYDRFLSKIPLQAIKVGLSLFEPVPEIDGFHENDIPLDYCATPDHFYAFDRVNLV